MKTVIIQIDEKTNRPVGWVNPYKPNTYKVPDTYRKPYERLQHNACEVGADIIIISGKVVDLDDAHVKYVKYVTQFSLRDILQTTFIPKSFTQYLEEL